ncbi:MAG: glycosyltransferase family 2 protein [bacterium]|nr:glycosyltransferase family 2 protein [bacterium]MDZ4295968.1 dolichyl-phosphate beta-glucosyltransferase [Patescibacteria group bacterium]
MHLSVIIPAYNEEKRIGRTLRAVNEYLRRRSYGYEIIVVSDGSRDGTVPLVKNLSEEIPHLQLIDNKENHGKGFVVRQGMLEAKGEIRLFMDADNSTSVDHIELMEPLFEQGYHVVIGTRDSRDNPRAQQTVAQSFAKRLAGDIGNLVIQALVVPGIWDTQCGFKAVSARAAQEIFSRMTTNRWAFDVEMLGLARKLDYKIGIIPVRWINDAMSHVKASAYIRFFFEVIKIWWRL